MSLDNLIKGKMQDSPKVAHSTSATLSIGQIVDRPSGDTRPLNPSHVEALAESIAAVGLIQPIAVDAKGRLLAGAHRRAAIRSLESSDLVVFEHWFSRGVPVHRFDFDADVDPELALAIEATENEKRRDYTATEVKELAVRLRQAGYEELKGRPKAGQKSVVLALSTIIGKSDKTVRRYLSDDGQSKGGHVSTFSPELAAKQVDKWLQQKGASRKVRELLKELVQALGD
jgi:ParB family transcriptional regulator, chromosome partitioning protein